MLILSPGGLQIRPNDHSAFFAYHAAIGTIQHLMLNRSCESKKSRLRREIFLYLFFLFY